MNIALARCPQSKNGQGDLVSPYLFVLAMEELTRIIRSKVANFQQLKYHPKYASLGITRLSFANDLLIFAAADLPSIHLIKEAFPSLVSQLTKAKVKFLVLLSKMTTSCNSSMGHCESDILDDPLSLVSSVLRICNPLIERIPARPSSWTARKLSFSGKLLMIQSILCSINVLVKYSHSS